MPIGIFRRRWIVSFHVRSSKGARTARASGLELGAVEGGGGMVMAVSVVASMAAP
jgi:hypothetical protein